jgi:hypothetical protein
MGLWRRPSSRRGTPSHGRSPAPRVRTWDPPKAAKTRWGGIADSVIGTSSSGDRYRRARKEVLNYRRFLWVTPGRRRVSGILIRGNHDERPQRWMPNFPGVFLCVFAPLREILKMFFGPISGLPKKISGKGAFRLPTRCTVDRRSARKRWLILVPRGPSSYPCHLRRSESSLKSVNRFTWQICRNPLPCGRGSVNSLALPDAWSTAGRTANFPRSTAGPVPRRAAGNTLRRARPSPS